MAGHRPYAQNIHPGRKSGIPRGDLAFPLDMVDGNDCRSRSYRALPCAKDRHVANGLSAGNQCAAFGNKARNAPD